MLSGADFLKMMDAKQKKEKGETLTPEEEANFLKYPEPQTKLCGCGCGKPLDPRIDGERPKIGGREVREDCYFDSCGEEIDKHPIGGLGVRRR